MCLDHNAVTPVRLNTTAPWSRVKHSTTEPLGSLDDLVMILIELMLVLNQGPLDLKSNILPLSHCVPDVVWSVFVLNVPPTAKGHMETRP